MDFKLLNKIKSFGEKQKHKLKGPKELPQQLGGYLVIQKSMDPDTVWALRCVLKPKETKNRYDFRIFSPVMVNNKGVRVVDFNSLDNRPDLILYHGWFDKYSNQVVFDKNIDNHAA